jgi:hypothetical protein
MERYLGSDALQLKSENDAFTLLLAWSEGLSNKDRRAAWARLIPQLRFQHMSLDFLGGVVNHRDHDTYAPQLREQVMSAICFKPLKPNITRLGNHCLKEALDRLVGEKDRAGDGQPTYEFTVHFELQDCLALKEGTSMRTKLGIARGFMTTVELYKMQESTLGIFIYVYRPWANLGPDVSVGDAKALRYRIEAGNRQGLSIVPFARWGMGKANFFDRPWGEVVREGSEFFPGGRLEVKVKLQFFRDDVQLDALSPDF